MADKKTETNIEREYVIPLRKEWQKVPRYKRANKAVKAIKEFLVRHMKVYDRDLNKVRVDKYLNSEIWFRGIKHPPARIKVKAVKDSEGIVRVELVEMRDNIKYRKAKVDKRDNAVEAPKKAKAETKKQENSKEDESGVDEKVQEDEKKEAVKEATQEREKAQAKKEKHAVKQDAHKPKRPIRQAMQK
jgi:large subunit ribosomal protein L31e